MDPKSYHCVVVFTPINFEHFGNIFGKGLMAKLWNLR
jgi:hypothetical protein